MTRFKWAEAGRDLGASLDHVHAIVVLGADPDATTEVALGIGRAQAARRRVAVGDLFGDAPPIERLLTGDDPHGLVDSFVYGVSLNRIARPVLGEENLFVMPGGSEPPEYEEMLPNPRWGRLASGFREVGALLILAAPAHAPSVHALVKQTDGAVVVGEMVPPQLPVAQVLATVRTPRQAGDTPPAAAAPLPDRRDRRRRLGRTLAGVGLASALAASGIWFAMGPMSRSGQRPVQIPRDSSVARAAQILPIADSTPPDSVMLDTTGTPVAARPEAVNPADSARAAAFAIELVALNTAAGAILKLQEQGGAVPAATMAPVLVDGGRWYRVVGGAFADRRGADSLLAALRSGRRVEDRTGQVVRLPLAFLLRGGAPADSVRPLVAEYARRGLPAYALRQPDGRINLYAGAFASPDEALLLTDLLTASGLTPTLAYRTGRSF